MRYLVIVGLLLWAGPVLGRVPSVLGDGYYMIVAGWGEVDLLDGSKMVALDVVLENVSSKKEVVYGPVFFSLLDEKNVEFQASLVSKRKDSLKVGRLSKGDKVRGTILFTIPVDQEEVVLFFRPPGVERVKLPLKLVVK